MLLRAVPTAVSAMVCIGGCGIEPIPDQTKFAPLSSLQERPDAIVRLYAAPIGLFELVAAHCFFVVKRADSAEFHRWEVWLSSAPPYGYVRLDFQPLEEGSGANVYVLAELIGTNAEPIVDFIETQSPNYPCRDFYLLLPGPNSSTYPQWVLDQTSWDVSLPPQAIGKDVPPNCP